MGSIDDLKLPLPKWLKIFTANCVIMPKAMAVAGKIYKDFNTPAKLAQLTEPKLKALGVDAKEDRKAVLTALRKSGHISRGRVTGSSPGGASSSSPIAGPSTSKDLTTVQEAITPTKKRKRTVLKDTNEFLPDGVIDEAASYGSLEFNEILDEEVLATKSTVVNRAPLMTAWATIVAERIGFQREEALSIASVYTEMNALSKGVSLGIFEKGKGKGMEASSGGTQPYVDLMGRRVALLQTQSGQWRALSKGSPVQPSAAFSYISRSLRQTTPHIMGALRLLSESFGPQEINSKAWNLYADFRPSVDGWGKRAEVRCETILSLRKKGTENKQAVKSEEVDTKSLIQFETLGDDVHAEDGHLSDSNEQEDEPERKKPRGLDLEEYEAALDEEFDGVDFSSIDNL